MPKPLEGIRVLDLSRIIAGPLCSLYLADLGADVVKVERPEGEEARHFGPSRWNGQGTTFLTLGRGKRSITVDLKDPADRDHLHRLAAKADVILENFRPGVMEQWGLGYDSVSRVNPGIVYCSLTGYGSTGPLSSHGANNLIAQAFGGLIGLQGNERPLGPAVTDMYAGVCAAVGIMGALIGRARNGGVGEYVQTSLLEAQAGLMSTLITGYLATGNDPGEADASTVTVPNQPFATRDGWIVLAVNSQEMWVRFCISIDAPEWIDDPRFATNFDRMQHRGEVVSAVTARLRAHSRDEWLDVFDRAKVTAAPVNLLSEFVQHEQTQAMRLLSPMPFDEVPEYQAMRLPFTYSTSLGLAELPPPSLGEHNGDLIWGVDRAVL